MATSTKIRVPAEVRAASVKLDSWKAIAAYMDRDPRTVQMWEKSEGFPVHRLAHNARPSVYAYTAEIDAWFQARSGGGAEPPEPEKPTQTALPQAPRRKILLRVLLLGALGCACIFGAALVAVHHRSLRATAPVATLAVLPFTDQTSTDGSLAAGLTNAVIADLGRMGKVRVITRHSVEALKDSHFPLDQMAAELHASLLLQGTVAQVDNRMQVTVELLDAAGGVHRWGATYARSGSNPAALPDQIASAVAVDVTRRITGIEAQAPVLLKAVDPRARRAYLTGRFYWNQRDLSGLKKAMALYQQALAIDPNYAAAYAGLAETYDLMTDWGILSDTEAFRRAREAAASALRLDPGSAEAYNALAFASYRADWDFGRAEQYFQKAIESNPDSAVAHQWYGEFLGDLQRFDASIAELRQARELDPLSPTAGADLADGYLRAGRIAEADAELNRVLDLYPNFAPARSYRIALALQRGDMNGARNEAQLYLEQTGDNTPLQMVEIRQLLANGKIAEARKAVERLMSGTESGAPSPFESAQLLFETGQTSEGYAALDRAYRAHSSQLVTMLVDPGFETVHSQPRFLAWARRVGLPVESSPAQLAMGPPDSPF